MVNVIFILLAIIVYTIYTVYTEGNDPSRKPIYNKRNNKEVNKEYKEFISQFNINNKTSYSTTGGDLSSIFNRCLVDYIFTSNYKLPSVANEKTIYGIGLHNYRYRDESNNKNTGRYKINDCDLYELCSCAKEQDIKSFYTSLFKISIDTFKIEDKVSLAKFIKKGTDVEVKIFTVYIDTQELCLNVFTIKEGRIESKARHLGDTSKYQ